MKLIIADVPPPRLEAVRQALAEMQVTRMSIADAHGYATADSGERITRRVVLEIAVNDDFLERTVATISAALEPPEAAGGGVFVLPIDEAVQLYRGVRGPEAV